MLNAANPNIETCHRCRHNQANQPGWVSGDCACLADPARRDIKERADAGDCELFPVKGRRLAIVTPRHDPAPAAPACADPVPADVEPPAPAEGWGPAMWKLLHTTKDADEAWLMGFSRRIPCGPCSAGWTALLKELPPAYGAGWFEWTWRAHNAVNIKLGKPAVGFAEALGRWVVGE